ncbi:MAG: DinB family protein [Bacteroidetes bacterium]|nr:DinB family protein [Bacteroidota bacterium]MCW5894559.1 DinB family protein [Bacteroidota bacterium]
MKRSIILACVLFFAGSSFADEPKGFRADLLGQISHVEKQILDLENAIPDKKMTWRPAKDVRSVSEVYMHVALANYFLLSFLGVAPPEGITLGNTDSAPAWEKSTTNKKEIADRMTSSFTFTKNAIKEMSDEDLEKQVEFFGQKLSARSMLMVLLSHLHEHLGQSIAYARMNNVVPPWTAAQQAAMQKSAK